METQSLPRMVWSSAEIVQALLSLVLLLLNIEVLLPCFGYTLSITPRSLLVA
jgi:hypothetical protein